MHVVCVCVHVHACTHACVQVCIYCVCAHAHACIYCVCVCVWEGLGGSLSAVMNGVHLCDV